MNGRKKTPTHTHNHTHTQTRVFISLLRRTHALLESSANCKGMSKKQKQNKKTGLQCLLAVLMQNAMTISLRKMSIQ